MIQEISAASLYLGAALAVGIVSISAGFGECQSAAYTIKAMARQPESAGTLLKSMLISAAVTETGAIFCLVVGLLLIFGGFLEQTVDLAKGACFLAAGLSVGLGTMGPNFGSGYTGAEACAGMARTPSQSMPLTTNMLVGQALAQTSAIYALVVSILLLYTVDNVSGYSMGWQIVRVGAYIGAALSIGIGTLGAGIGTGYAVGVANRLIARYVEQRGLFMRLTILSSAIAQTTAIYAMVISFLLIFI